MPLLTSTSGAAVPHPHDGVVTLEGGASNEGTHLSSVVAETSPTTIIPCVTIMHAHAL